MEIPLSLPLPTPEAEELRTYMSGLSEEAYCAGWMMDLEFDLWAAVVSGGGRYGRVVLDERIVTKLRDLSGRCGGCEGVNLTRALLGAGCFAFAIGTATCFLGVRHDVAQIPAGQRARMSDTDWIGAEWVLRGGAICGAGTLLVILGVIHKVRRAAQPGQSAG